MRVRDVIRAAAKNAGKKLTYIGPELGKDRSYISVIMSNGVDPSCKTMSDILSVCGYELCAVEKGTELPEGSFVITDEDRAK